MLNTSKQKAENAEIVPRNRVRRHETTGLYSSQLIQLSGRSLYVFGRCVLSADTGDTSSLVKSADSRGQRFSSPLFSRVYLDPQWARWYSDSWIFFVLTTRLRAWFSEKSDL